MKSKLLLLALIALFSCYCFKTPDYEVPVVGMTKADYNQKTFWHPWGNHNHRGVDIFAKKGTEVVSSTNGIVIKRGTFGSGGNVVAVLSSNFQIYYYAHLDKDNDIHVGEFVKKGELIGYVGNSGNAINTPSHLHYSISSPFKISDKYDSKFLLYFYNPVDKLNKSLSI